MVLKEQHEGLQRSTLSTVLSVNKSLRSTGAPIAICSRNCIVASVRQLPGSISIVRVCSLMMRVEALCITLPNARSAPMKSSIFAVCLLASNLFPLSRKHHQCVPSSNVLSPPSSPGNRNWSRVVVLWMLVGHASIALKRSTYLFTSRGEVKEKLFCSACLPARVLTKRSKSLRVSLLICIGHQTHPSHYMKMSTRTLLVRSQCCLLGFMILALSSSKLSLRGNIS